MRKKIAGIVTLRATPTYKQYMNTTPAAVAVATEKVAINLREEALLRVRAANAAYYAAKKGKRALKAAAALATAEYRLLAEIAKKVSFAAAAAEHVELMATTSEMEALTAVAAAEQGAAVSAADFFKATECLWQEVAEVPADAVRIWNGGGESRYQIAADGSGVYRTSDHWGKVASCKWIIADCPDNGVCHVYSERYTGFARWADFKKI